MAASGGTLERGALPIGFLVGVSRGGAWERTEPERVQAGRSGHERLDSVCTEKMLEGQRFMEMDLKKLIRTIPDYPKPGILFRDITTLLEDAEGFRQTIQDLVRPLASLEITRIAGIEARGFILGGAVAHELSVGFIAVRKKGKLPGETHGVEYELEYGTDEMEVHVDSIGRGDRVLLVDDLIATGGSACAAVELARLSGGEVVGASFVIDLPDLGGRKRLEAMGVPVRSLMEFEGD